jgi:hypothetical protein
MQNNLCANCKNYIGEGKCKAFPSGIPDMVLLGDNNHEKIISGQIGQFVFSKLS